MKKLNRRSFMKKGSTMVAGGYIAGSTMDLLGTTDSDEKENKNPVNYRILGNTKLKVSEVGYGAMRTKDAAVIQYALDLGINFIDTAHVYQGGNNEILVGTVIAPRRKDVILCTKIRRGDKKELIRDFETSLKRLRTDYVDILYYHSMKNISHIHDDVAMELFSQWKKEGRIRFTGFSTHSNEAELLNQAAEDKFWDVILVAYNFKKEKELTDAINKAAAAGIGIVAMKTQAGGYKTEEMGSLSPHQAALKWVLQNQNVHTTIPSMATFDELEEDIQVMGQPMGWRERKTLYHYGESIDRRYCRSCGACKSMCPNGVDIPEVNRCYMYLDGYRDAELAHVNYGSLSVAHNARSCESCDKCSAQCKYGIDLEKRMPAMNALLG
ncbi:MAG: aldo/keto reductase [candidate division KSB1 bacterium]|nr:aldo/keto reductase [candidate division KSB1 bacterium]